MTLLSTVGISKRFGEIVALDNVSLDLNEGEILGVLGENGSGKSTLAKIIYGVYVPDGGYVVLHRDGKPQRVFFTSPRDAMTHGIVMISQRPQLVEELSVVENIALFLGVSPSMAERAARSTLSKFNIDLPLEKTVEVLSYTEKQFVELVKALSYRPRLLIVDEVTTYLPKNFRERFYEVLKMFVSLGGSVMFITHKIPEALEICDRIAVLRRGKLVGIYNKSNNISVDMIRKTVFNEVAHEISLSRTEPSRHEVRQDVLRVENIVALDDYGGRAVDGASFAIARGRVLAIVGIAGNGQKELCESIVGLRKIISGRIILDEEDVTRLGAAKRILKGLVYVPEDPFRDGVAMDLTIAENLRLFSEAGIERDTIARLLNELKVQPPNPVLKVYKLSGGNVQKISISRLRLSKPKCAIAYNPTRMLDEASSRFVKEMLRDLAKNGVGVLVVTEDIDEALDVADEVAVISRGKIVKSFITGNTSIREEIEKAMALYG